jgi:peptide/nickel transport system substrate-binding protein
MLQVGAGLGALAIVVSACGSTSKGASGGSGGTGGSGGSGGSGGAASTGSGLNQPTSPSGSKQTGGTVYFTEGSSAPPNYIFPMTSAQVCGTNNIDQLNAMLFRPLYWYGNNYSPTIDYNYSVGKAPVYSNNDQTVTVSLNSWKWSDGESVTARDVEFWVNLYKADPAANYCGFVPGLFPTNVTSMSSPNPQTVVFQLNKSYDPQWFTYNELSQIYPLPLAWDRTSLSQPAPTSDTGNLPDSTKAGAESVYKFLDAQSKDVATWGSSPLWSIVDGPFKLKSFTTTGEVTLVPNTTYSGSPKPTITAFVEVPFTDDAAEFNQIRAGGPNALTIANLPATYAPQTATVEAQGYTLNKGASYSVNFFPLNLNNPKMGPIFKQTYFRQAFQHLIDQPGWINAFLHNTANQTVSPIPSNPPNPLVSYNASTNPFAFSTSAASQLLTSHGWKVAPGGTTTCQSAGTGANQCGAGITAGEGISFNIDYESGAPAVESEMNDLVAQAKQVGISIDLTSHPFNTVISTATQCSAGQPTCNWTAENWGAGWIYAPDFLPTGESLFLTGASANFSNYNDAGANSVINATIFGPQSQEKQALSNYAQYMEQNLPVVFGPTSIGTYAGDAGQLLSNKLGGYTANAFGYLTPETYYLAK